MHAALNESSVIAMTERKLRDEHTDAVAHLSIEDGLLVVRIVGPQTAEFHREIRDEYLHLDEFVRGMPALYDLREAVLESISTRGLEQIAGHGQDVAAKRIRRGEFQHAGTPPQVVADVQ